MENFTSTPFSSRDSGSAFISQYRRPLSSVAYRELAFVDSDSAGWSDLLSSTASGPGFFLGLPLPRCFGVSVLGVVTVASNALARSH